MDWDWSRVLGSEPGQHTRLAKLVTWIYVVLGIGWLAAGLWRGWGWSLILGLAFLALGLYGLGVALGRFPRRGVRR